MPAREAPCVELGNAPDVQSIGPSPSPSEISSATSSSPEPQHIRATPLFRALAMPPPEPVQPPGQEELERRLPGYRRIVIPRELTLIELLKEYSGVRTDEEVLTIREAKLRVIAERVGLRRLHVLTPRLRSLTLDGSCLSSLRDLGIGLVHLKYLSINRCGLTCLDGIWGLEKLFELHAANNRLQDLQPLGALQKLHTLNLSCNPIQDASRIWTLGVCGSLRRLTLSGTPASETPQYRMTVATSLPMLIYLDDEPLHNDIEYDIQEVVSSSDSEGEVIENKIPDLENKVTEVSHGASSSLGECLQHIREEASNQLMITTQRRRPATAEGVGIRPAKPTLPPRPRTALDRPTKTLTRLEFLNTLMDDEWRSTGSKLTSQAPVCGGNLARALRRRPIATSRPNWETELEMVEESIQEATRAVASEIPRAPCVEDWDAFRLRTGIDIQIDFNERPRGLDSTLAIERLEQIERDTSERFKEEESKTKADDQIDNTEIRIADP